MGRTYASWGIQLKWDGEGLYLMVLPGTSPKRRIKWEEREREPSEAWVFGPPKGVAAISGMTLCHTLVNERNDKGKVNFFACGK